MILNFMFMTILWVPIETFSYWQQTRGFHWVDLYNFEHLVYLSLYLLVALFLSQAQYISKLVKIAGITIAASRTKAKATYVTLICKNCKKGKQVPCRPGLGGAIVPRSCDHIPQVLFVLICHVVLCFNFCSVLYFFFCILHFFRISLTR